MKNIKIVKARYIVDSNGYRHGKAVMCLDTGEVFTSAKECADVKQFPYNDFSTKLRNGKEAKDGKHVPNEDGTNIEIIKEATCTEDGECLLKCQLSNQPYSEVIPATGHQEVKDQKVEATCTKTGLTEGSHCSVCGKVLKEQEEIPKTEHNWNKGKVVKEASCEKTGINTMTAEDPMTAVAIGTGKYVEFLGGRRDEE